MKASDATLLALHEFADPACRRCRGRGATGDDLVATLCRCVRRRVPADDAATTAEPQDDEALPHPWGVITRRAQQIHAAMLIESLPDTWS